MKIRRTIAAGLVAAAVLSCTVSAYAETETTKDNSSDFGNVKVGDTLKFGTYEQDNNLKNGAEAIEWTVLDKDDESILVVSKKALDCHEFNTDIGDDSWETSSLRSWLNETFLNYAFTSDEKKQIVTSVITTETFDRDNNLNLTEKDSEDKIFPLSTDEANEYFKTDAARKCEITAYAKAVYNAKATLSKQNYDDLVEWYGIGNWWLRSSGFDSSCVSFVDADGSSKGYEYVTNSYFCVRPAMRISISENTEPGDTSDTDETDKTDTAAVNITYVDKAEDFASMQENNPGKYCSWNYDQNNTSFDMLFELHEDGGMNVYIYTDDKDARMLMKTVDEISSWTDIKQIDTSFGTPVALLDNGDVVFPTLIYFQNETVTINNDGLLDIKTLIPVQCSQPDSNVSQGFIGIDEDGNITWVISKGITQSERETLIHIIKGDQAVKIYNDSTSRMKFTNNSGEPVKIYHYTGNYYTVLLSGGMVISNVYTDLNSIDNANNIIYAFIYGNEIGMIAVTDDGNAVISETVLNEAKVPSKAVEEMKKEISSWKNVKDISVYFDDQKIVAILSDGSVVYTDYNRISDELYGTNYYSPENNLMYTSIKNAESFTDEYEGRIVLKNGTVMSNSVTI